MRGELRSIEKTLVNIEKDVYILQYVSSKEDAVAITATLVTRYLCSASDSRIVVRMFYIQVGETR